MMFQVKVMKYQDELEAGKRSRKPNMSISDQVEYHRKKLLSKVSFINLLILTLWLATGYSETLEKLPCI